MTWPPEDLDQFIRDHHALVERVAYRVTPPRPYDHDDLVAIGLEALLHATESFDPERAGGQFKPYAGQFIQRRLIDWVRANQWSFNRHAHTHVKKLRRLGVEPSRDELSRVQEIPLSLDEKVNSTNGHGAMDDGAELGELIPDAKVDVEASVVSLDTHRRLAQLVSGLPERERYVILAYYKGGQSLREIGVTLGVTESRVSQLRSKAVSRLYKQRSRLAA